MSVATVRVSVLYSPAPREVHEWKLSLPAGATVSDALHASGLPSAFPALKIPEADVGVWGRRVAPADLLGDGDRVEIYRPLLVDPKVARRERFRKQGARAAGLFAGRKDGAKAGY